MKRCLFSCLLAVMTTLVWVLPSTAATPDPLVGTWSYDSFNVQYVDGAQTPPGGAPNPYGANAAGYFIVDGTGHFVMGIIGERPKFAGTNRRDGTPQEYAAVVKSTELIFGTYTIDNAKRAMIAHIERAMFPNWDGGDRTWTFTIAGDELRQIFPVTPSAGGAYIPIGNLEARSLMYYEPGVTRHGMPFDPFKSCVVPRPIGWISTISSAGIANLAPFSQFQNLSFDPPHVMLSASEATSGARKDTIVNIEQTGHFVWNMATYDLREAVNASAQEVASHVDEFELAGLTKRKASIVTSPMVAESPIHFECEHVETIRLARGRAGSSGLTDLIIARVVAVHIDDDVIDNGRIDILKVRPLARLGYHDYTSIDHTFEMKVPGNNALLLAGLEGNQEAFSCNKI